MFNNIPDMVCFEGNPITVNLTQFFTEEQLETYNFSLNLYSDSDCKELLCVIGIPMMDHKTRTITAPPIYGHTDIYGVVVAESKEVTENVS